MDRQTSPIKAEDSNIELKWTPSLELEFFKAAIGLKPTGFSKHFIMSVILHRFLESSKVILPSTDLWKQLEQLYDLESLDDSEVMPIPYDEDGFDIPDEYVPEYHERRKQPPSKEEVPTKVIKDYSRNKGKQDASKKKEETSVTVKIENNDDTDDDLPLKVEKTDKKGKAKSTPVSVKKEQPTPPSRSSLKRGKRGVKESTEGDSSPVVKKEDETTVKKEREKINVGKRTLRSRGDDESSNKSSSPAPTPPPAKRARRI